VFFLSRLYWFFSFESPAGLHLSIEYDQKIDNEIQV